MPSSKILILLRHAKSSWKAESLDDFDRPLAARGKRAAAQIGRYLFEHSLIPEHVLCSPARRTSATWHLVDQEIGSGATVEMPEILYGAGNYELLRQIMRISEAVTTLTVIGHLPAIDGLALNLSGNQDHKDWQRMRRKFPTAGLAILRFQNRRWDQCAEAAGLLDRFVTPKDIENRRS
jgi:phosphohistidine phosphatase